MNEKTQMFYEGTYTDFGVQPDLLEINIGSNLLPLVADEEDKKGPLVEELLWLRNKLDDELGLVLPKVRVRDSSYLAPDEYAIFLSGNEVAKSSVRLGHYLCLDTGSVRNPLDTTKWEKTKDPAYDMDGFIIPESEAEMEKEAGYVCASPEKIVRVHLYEIIEKNITKILNQSMVNELVEKVRKINPDVITDLFFTRKLSISNMKIILNRLLEEDVSIRDMNTILETTADYIGEAETPLQLAEKIRERLAPSFIKEYVNEKNCLHIFKLSHGLSEYLADHVYFPESKVDKPYLALDPSDRNRLIKSLTKCLELSNKKDFTPMFVCVASLRPFVSDFVRENFPLTYVFSDKELLTVKKDINFIVEKEVDFEDK